MTVNEVLTAACEARDNRLAQSTLLRELNRAEASVAQELFGLTTAPVYTESSLSAEMLLISPHDEFYVMALMSRIDYLLGEMNLYVNDTAAAASAYNDALLSVCRHGARQAAGDLAVLPIGSSVSLSIRGIPFADDDVSSISVAFTARGSTILTLTEGVLHDGTLTVSLSAEESGLFSVGIARAVATVVSADEEATHRSHPIRLLCKED